MSGGAGFGLAGRNGAGFAATAVINQERQKVLREFAVGAVNQIAALALDLQQACIHQLTQVKLGRMVMIIQAARQFSYAVAKMMGKGEGAMEASMVKAYVCKAAEWVTREAMQIHGGYGYAEEYSVSRLFVDARVLSIFEGADETLCLKVIARRLCEESKPR